MSFSTASALSFADCFGRRSQQWIRPLRLPFAHLRELQELYETGRHLQGRAFIGHLLRQLRITVEYVPDELRRIPAQGTFVALANQPHGVLDSLVLLYLLSEIRADTRVVATKLLRPVLTNLAAQLVVPEPERVGAGHYQPRARRLLPYLHNDVPLVLLPTEEASQRAVPFTPAPDPTWHPAVGQLLAAARVPVVPLWLSSRGGASLRWAAVMQPLLPTPRLPAELLSMRGQTVRVRIGELVAPGTLAHLPGPDQLAYLQAQVQALGVPASAGNGRTPSALSVPPAVGSKAAVAYDCIEADIKALRNSRCLVRHQQWEVYIARTEELPHVLRAIGQLRAQASHPENAQPETGLDAYDAHYRHVFLYDRMARHLVGAYRIGRGGAVMRRYGKRGFYLHTLFRFRKPLVPLLRQSLEVGQGVIREEYQKQPLPLLLLWKGIAEYIAARPEYHYLIGSVNVSRHFPGASKTEMLQYLQQYYGNAELAQAVLTRKRFRFCPLDTDDARFATPPHQGNTRRELLHCLAETRNQHLPALLRHYLQKNARCIGFNRAPDFSNTLEGLFVVDARALPACMHHLAERYTAQALQDE